MISHIMCRVSWLEVFAPYKPRYAASICWMNNKHASLVFFLLPVAALLAENFLLFLVTVYGIHSSRARDLQQQQPTAGTGVKFAENVEDKKWSRQKNRISAANRLIGEVVQSRRRPLLGPYYVGSFSWLKAPATAFTYTWGH